MVFTLFYFVLIEAFDPLDPTGNVTIRWDIMSWTSDGYMVSHFDRSLRYLERLVSATTPAEIFI